ncbi:hypothetical protein N9V13_01325 [Betaproteobacteria bacterium]|nr:hypothetical protein [Betaproteobacteria bacterium]
MNAKACLLAFVIELKKRLENKESLKVNISESIYSKISNIEFKEIFYDQINEIEDFNKYLLEVTIVKMKNSQSEDKKEFFEIIRVASKVDRYV